MSHQEEILSLKQQLQIFSDVHDVNKKKYDAMEFRLRVTLRALEVMTDSAERFADEVDLLRAQLAKSKESVQALREANNDLAGAAIERPPYKQDLLKEIECLREEAGRKAGMMSGA